MRKLTEFEFYKNTPLVDLKNTIYFKSNSERDNFFNTTYEKINMDIPFNFIKDRGTLRITGSVEDFKDVNYCRFKSEFEPDIYYYCFIPEYKYINDSVIELNLLIDGVMTFCQGNVLNNLTGINVKRQHIPKEIYDFHLNYLRNNDDVIKTFTKKYFHEEKVELKEFTILIESTVSLFGHFGYTDNPKINSSTGCRFDDIVSPVDLYILDEDDFEFVMKSLRHFPWITQNFKKISLVPKALLNRLTPEIETVPVENEQIDLSDVYKIVGGKSTPIRNVFEPLNKSMNDLYKIFGLDAEQDKHILRNEYTTIELYDFQGQSLFIDTGQLFDTGLKIDYVSVAGYENIISIYLKGYKGSQENYSSFLNDSITFNNFDEVPILVDSYNLELSKSANQRQYRESNLLTGKVKRIIDSDNNIQDRLVSAVSILSNISPMSLGQGLVDEHEYFRSQLAQEKDLALNSDIVTNQTNSTGLARNNNFLGITMLFSKPDILELNKIKKYYKLFGYDLEGLSDSLYNTRSMSLCNYVEFEGNFHLDKVERSILDVIKIRFENGIRLWHNKNIRNPFIQDIQNNIMVGD